MAAALVHGVMDPGLAQRVRIMGRLLGGDWVSGQSLARELGISRSAVHKHVDSLRSSGAEIASVRGNGYRLTAPWDSLAPEAVLPLLLDARGKRSAASATGEALHFGLPYLYEPEVGSTNVLLKAGAVGGLPSGAVAVTDHQVAGRGRLGRRWASEAGKDVTLSVLLRTEMVPQEASRMVIAAALAVADVARGVVAGTPEGLGPAAAQPQATAIGIKWPNDVLLGGRKVCGILAEASMDMDRVHWMVVGIGLNVNSHPAVSVPPGELPPGRVLPLSLSEWTGRELSRGLVASLLLERLASRLDDAARGRWDAVRAAYESLDVLRGAAVSVRAGATGDDLAAGAAAGIDDLGRLLVRRPDGMLQAVPAGDVTIVVG